MLRIQHLQNRLRSPSFRWNLVLWFSEFVTGIIAQQSFDQFQRVYINKQYCFECCVFVFIFGVLCLCAQFDWFIRRVLCGLSIRARSIMTNEANFILFPKISDCSYVSCYWWVTIYFIHSGFSFFDCFDVAMCGGLRHRSASYPWRHKHPLCPSMMLHWYSIYPHRARRRQDRILTDTHTRCVWLYICCPCATPILLARLLLLFWS